MHKSYTGLGDKLKELHKRYSTGSELTWHYQPQNVIHFVAWKSPAMVAAYSKEVVEDSYTCTFSAEEIALQFFLPNPLFQLRLLKRFENEPYKLILHLVTHYPDFEVHIKPHDKSSDNRNADSK